MKVFFGFVDDCISKDLKAFLENNGMIFQKYSDLLGEKEKKLFIFNPSLSKELISKEIENIKKKNIQNIFFMVSKQHIETSLKKDENNIFYPVNIKNFNELVFSKNISDNVIFKELFLEQDNFLINKLNNKKTYLTETEHRIIRLLFANEIVKKDRIKKEILNFQVVLDTKSLESHLSRLRKKISEIDSGVTIISLDPKTLKII